MMECLSCLAPEKAFLVSRAAFPYQASVPTGTLHRLSSSHRLIVSSSHRLIVSSPHRLIAPARATSQSCSSRSIPPPR